MKLSRTEEVSFATSFVTARVVKTGMMMTWGALKGALFGAYMGALCAVIPLSAMKNPYDEIPRVDEGEPFTAD